MISKEFEKELGYITDTNLREFITKVLDSLPVYFSTTAASTTGKYHPSYALGEGGLVRHTKAAVRIAKELIGSGLFGKMNEDVIYASLIVHDGLKCGNNGSQHTVFDHPMLISQFVEEKANEFNFEDKDTLAEIKKCVECHMGQWNTDKRSSVILPKPETKIEKVVHLADYLASRKCLEFNFEV
jgi:23S rRNA maturation-related 3'-5' exoribonuclease YhaM